MSEVKDNKADQSEYIEYLEGYISKLMAIVELSDDPDEQELAIDKQVGGNHYKDMPIQPVQFNQMNSVPYMEGSAIKYVCRHQSKGGRQDLEKAIHFIEMAIEHYYPEACK